MSNKTLNGYVCFTPKGRLEIYAATAWEAEKEAIARHKVPKSKRGLVSTTLAEKNGEPVVHNPAIL